MCHIDVVFILLVCVFICGPYSERMVRTHVGTASDQPAGHGCLLVHSYEFCASVGQQTDQSQRRL